MVKDVRISASILAADFSRLSEEIENILVAGVDWIHFDVMDHHFVPNLSFGSVVCQSLRKAGITAPIDVHLMVEKPEQYIDAFAKAGATLMTIHPETTQDVDVCLSQIKAQGMQAGLALNPDKELSIVEPYLSRIDLLLLMSVHPGFAGQSFLDGSLDKINRARHLINAQNSPAWLGIDGGIKPSNIHEVVENGADFCIMGSGLFNASDYMARMREIRDNLSSIV